MKWFGKIAAGIVLGIIAVILSSFVFDLSVGGKMAGSQAGMWVMLATFVVVLGLALSAPTGKKAWGWGNILCGLLSFALPLVGLVFSGVVGGNIADLATRDQAYASLQQIGITPESVLVFANEISEAETGAETAGAAIGAAMGAAIGAELGGMMVIGTLILIGLLPGLIFIVMAGFLLRGGTIEQQQLLEEPVVSKRAAEADKMRQDPASPAQDPIKIDPAGKLAASPA